MHLTGSSAALTGAPGRVGHAMLGRSAPMREVHRLIEQAAATPAPVLIHGETGTGKELVARTLHELSARSGGPFVAVNCAAMPETLLESEIFGHERGAFTDARDRREGCFELAHGGTLLLDEVAEMQPGTQAKFLRVLEEGAFRRLGGKIEITVDVRVVAATNKDPVAAMKAGAFREDLYYRLNVFTLAVPPCGSGPRTSRSWSPASSRSSTASTASASPAPTTPRSRSSWRTHGPGTCASCATWWSARSSAATAA